MRPAPVPAPKGPARMFLVTPDTVWNPVVLETREVPRPFMGLVSLWPRRGATWRLRARLWFEREWLRYAASLLPFVLAAVIWPGQAIAIAQAPLPMFAVVYLVETRFLRVPRDRRAAFATPAEIERAQDAFRARARAILARIAAGRRMTDGALWLVAEQSDLARVAPLTWVSVQAEATATEGPRVLALTEAEEATVATLFAGAFTEAALHRANLAEGVFLRSERLAARGLSAHARMAALTAG